MQDMEFWAVPFEEQRPRLRSVAYRMLGSFAEAEDALQESWLRVSRASGGDVENIGGWLTTIVSRQCLNMLRSRETRREDPLDVRVPDPVVESGMGIDPAEQGVLADSVGLALLFVLDSLDPAERLAFVLHDSWSGPSGMRQSCASRPASTNSATTCHPCWPSCALPRTTTKAPNANASTACSPRPTLPLGRSPTNSATPTCRR